MNKKELLYKYINKIKRKKLLTEFIKLIFNYQELYDYNYLFRITKDNDNIIIDIYDNVSNNRFNRYILNYSNKYKNRVVIKNSVYVTYINVNKIKKPNNNLERLIYLFNLAKNKMPSYSKTFLTDIFIDVLKEMLGQA